tara:strand:- start:181 stop:1197 length:1017 start_codon:yes stop_codon:yes gene_type:complete
MSEDGRDYLVYASYSLLNFPKILSRIMPFSIFFSFLYVISKYELNNELLILWNFGINKIQFVNFILLFAILLTILQILITSLIVPKSQNIGRSIIRSSNINFFENFIKPKRFNDTIKGLTIYSEGKTEDGNLKNIYLKKNTGENNFQITYAKKGSLKNINNNQFLILYDGETLSSANKKISNFSFSSSDFSLKNLKTNTTTVIKTQETSTEDLIRCVEYLSKKKQQEALILDNCKYENLDNVFKELYKRFIIPLYIPIIILISLLILMKSKENINFYKYRIIIFLLGFSTIIFSETTIRFTSDNLNGNFKIIILPIIIFLLLYFVFLFQFKLKLLKHK